MKKILGLCWLTCACGNGAVPELYQVSLDYFVPPATCYRTGMQPTDMTTMAPQTGFGMRVWDGPDSKAYLQLENAPTAAIDMGDAPSVSLDGVYEGTNGVGGWTFATARSSQTVNGLNMDKTTETESAAFTFARGGVITGTLALSSASTCVGATGCPAMNPSCTISGVAFRGTALASDYSIIDYTQTQ
jgi:hypothetical protein